MTNYDYAVVNGNLRVADMLKERYERNANYRKATSDVVIPWNEWLFCDVDEAMDHAKIGQLVRILGTPNLFGIVTGYWHSGSSQSAFNVLTVKIPSPDGQTICHYEPRGVEPYSLPAEAVEALLMARCVAEEEEKQ